MTGLPKMSKYEIEFCKLFNESIRSRIIIRLLNNDELKITDFSLDDSRLKNYFNDKISRKAINNNLRELMKEGFVKFRKQGLYVYWSINKNNVLLDHFKKTISGLEGYQIKKWSRNTDSEIKEYLFGYYSQYEKFKPAELKAKLNRDSYPISSARLSQVLRGFVDQGILKKEEKARYKIVDKHGYENYN